MNVQSYQDKNTTKSDVGSDVVDASKACLPPAGSPVTEPHALPCLDVSLSPNKLVGLTEAQSIFGNGEICRRSLNTDLFTCISAELTAVKCRFEHVTALSLFARSYYLCTDYLEKEQMDRIQGYVQAAEAQNTTTSAATS